MIWFIAIIATLSIVLNVYVISKNIILLDQRETLVDTIEQSLDMLDDIYTRIAHNAEIPVLSDEPVIREVLADIKGAKHAVLTIAQHVVTYGTESDNEENE